jgi:ribonuclease HI
VTKGKPGKEGAGRVIRDEEKSKAIIPKFLGEVTNNQAEMEGIKAGYRLGLHLQEIIFEGYSKFIIHFLLKKSKDATWHMEGTLELIGEACKVFKGIHFQHTRKKASQVADLVTNLAIKTQ